MTSPRPWREEGGGGIEGRYEFGGEGNVGACQLALFSEGGFSQPVAVCDSL